MLSNPSRVSRIHWKMQPVPFARRAMILAAAASFAAAAFAQQPQGQQPAPTGEKPAPASQADKPNVPLAPPPSYKTDYAKDWVVDLRYWLVRSDPQVRIHGGDPASQFSFKNDIGGSLNNNRPWIEIGIPTKHGNRLWMSYFETTLSGGGLNNRALTFFDQSYDPSTLLNDKVKVRNFKLSWDYLTWPAPPNAMRKWQFKTLWEVQAINIAPTVTSTILVQNSDGTYTDNGTTTAKSKLMILPSIGAGLEGQPAKGVDVLFKGSGFLWLHQKYIYDVEARIGVKVKFAELLIGYRRLYGSMGNTTEQYFRAGLSGPYAGLAWHF